MDFTNDELSLIKDMLDDFADRVHHYPDDYKGDEEVFASLSVKFNAAFKAAGFWWAR